MAEGYRIWLNRISHQLWDAAIQWISSRSTFGYGWDKWDVLEDEFGIMEAKDLGKRVIRFIELVKRGGW